ncbi:hypothetical protein M406DRAFT_33063 [Cryphonectria parasitica EP155]|uniref:Uncharacterized protein n=1 Tax=Cryphonectria parasitica (strain ATCC 38755 / EP155) TaxID=660469 RepID=A0A9P4YET2_CRYP1|nr:uncharacterized protein M406DRAFT_33063 [Cryphonectria parasitica EP155]KAF3771419.1 hypothetical protein M406DRAFT_33063 [Cryphonectria parasitica EP155]
MIGMSISPFIAGLFRSFTTSIFIALTLFAFCIIYLHLCLGSNTVRNDQSNTQIQQVTGSTEEGRQSQETCTVSSTEWLPILISPLKPFQKQPSHLLISLSLLSYNLVQSYIFTCLLIYTSVRFGFTGKENGFIISIAHSIAALYVFTTLYIGPRAMACLHSRCGLLAGTKRRDLILACISLTIQTASLAVLGLAKEALHLYVATVLLSFSLPASSFIKAYFASNFNRKERPMFLAALAAMEMLGSILSPLVFGSLQAYFTVNGVIFYIAAQITEASLIMLIVGSLFVNRSHIVAE